VADIYIAANKIQKLPKGFRNLVNLKFLSLQANLMEDFDEQICYLEKLKELYVGENQLRSLSPKIGGFVVYIFWGCYT
jgi:Leucine-rich repeat (LRR) protein